MAGSCECEASVGFWEQQLPRPKSHSQLQLRLTTEPVVFLRRVWSLGREPPPPRGFSGQTLNVDHFATRGQPSRKSQLRTEIARSYGETRKDSGEECQLVCRIWWAFGVDCKVDLHN